jgi:PAS domain S-box-containing protein
MSKDLLQLRGDYISALSTYLKNGDEASLNQAYSLGRRAMNEGFGVLDMADLQASAMRALIVHAPFCDHATDAAAAGNFFRELLSPFEMSHLGYRAENHELRRLNEAILQQKEQLHAAEERYRRLTETAPDIVFRYELQPRRGYSYVNPVVTDISGYSPEEHYADPELGFKIVHPEDRPLLDSAFRGVFPSGSAITVRWLHKTGTVKWIEQRNVLLCDEHGQPLAIEGIARDVTERRSLEDQVQRAQRLESVGRLAGGVAHDFNNMLTVINGFTKMAVDDLSPGSAVRENLSEVLTAAERAAGLTQQLLAFSRKQLIQPNVLSLNTAVLDIRKMLQRLIGEDIDFQTRLASDLANVRADSGQIQQVIMNLAVNSRDAMPDGGELVIETANVGFDDDYVALHPESRHGPHVMLAVSDTGAGMTAEVKARLFEPFFTTKPQGVGTGLGLAVVYGIVKQANGWIEIYSEPGCGSTFKVYFPRIDEPADQARTLVKTDVRGTETILVVEDAPDVRNLTVRALKKIGYAVYSAGRADEALGWARSFTDPIDLVVTDIVMPGMNGRELAEQLTKMRPGLRVLYVSGYTEENIAHRGVLDTGIAYLQKPFTPASLGEKVREVLGPRAPATPRVLVIDKDGGIRGLMRRWLGAAGYEVREAANVEEVLERPPESLPDLAVADLLLPEEKGLEALRSLREQYPKLGIVAISGAFGVDAVRVTAELGAIATLPKPLVQDDFLRVVRGALAG